MYNNKYNNKIALFYHLIEFSYWMFFVTTMYIMSFPRKKINLLLLYFIGYLNGFFLFSSK